MSNPRRRVLRAAQVTTQPDPRLEARLHRRRADLAKSRAALRRWLTRLKRATNTVTDLHQRITRLEAALAVEQ